MSGKKIEDVIAECESLMADTLKLRTVWQEHRRDKGRYHDETLEAKKQFRQHEDMLGDTFVQNAGYFLSAAKESVALKDTVARLRLQIDDAHGAVTDHIVRLESQLAEARERIEQLTTCRSAYAKRPILYTDTVNGEQSMRDDLWAVSTAELNELRDSLAAREGEVERWKEEAINVCNLLGELAQGVQNPTALSIRNKIRDEALEEAANVCEMVFTTGDVALTCANDIRALTTKEPTK